MLLLHRHDVASSERASAEAPLVAILGLALFFWIFLTNSLPAKRELAGRLAQVQRYTAERGRLIELREQLAREEDLALAVREDGVVRRALFLLEHPTAEENDPERLLVPFSFESFPAEPEQVVLPDPEESATLEVSAPRGTANDVAPAGSETEEPSVSPDSNAHPDLEGERPATPSHPPAIRGGESPRGAATPKAGSGVRAPSGAGSHATRGVETPPRRDAARRDPPRNAPAKRAPSGSPASPKPSGRFDVPSFLRG